jgi:hypothetical protein
VGRPKQAHQRLAAAAEPGRAARRRPGRARRAAAAWLPALLLAGLVAQLAGCASSEGQWVRRDDSCVREAPEGPTRRVINYVDPELCGRSLRYRSKVYVRVVPPPGMRSQ